MSQIKCHFFQPADKVKRFFRRYEDGKCNGVFTYHNAEILRDEIEVPTPDWGTDETDDRMIGGVPDDILKHRFPVKCDKCDFHFTEKGSYQLNNERQYKCADLEEYYSLRDLPHGAMYFADWYGPRFTPQLDYSLIVITPAGGWHVDSQSRNCTMPDDYYQLQHHCWIIEGNLPNITVSKNGKTCGAGGGSIQIENYHGFLRNGYLEEC